MYQQLYVSIPGQSFCAPRLATRRPLANTWLIEHLTDARHPNAYRVDIPTAVVEEPQKGMDRLRFWRKKTYVAV